MAAQQLSLETLSVIEAGAVARVWNIAIEQAIRDCSDRPGETAKRSVILHAEFKPSSGDDGSVDDLEVNFQIQKRFPAYHTGGIAMRIRKRGQQLMLAFDDELAGATEE